MNSSALSRQRLDLLKTIQSIQFGRIEHLQVVRGDPVLQPLPRIVRNLHFAKATQQEYLPKNRHFQLKWQHAQLFDLFDRRQSFEIERLEVKNGLPFEADVPDREGA